MSQTRLNDDNMNSILVKAITLIEEERYLLALEFLDTVVDALAPDAFLLKLRARAYAELRNWDNAIVDIREAACLNPDEAGYHLSLGVYRTLQLFGAHPHRFQDHCTVLQEIQAHYADCLARDPSNQTAWLNSTETHLFLRQWDLAIAAYADSRAYITDTPHQVTRSWLGCLALAFSGEPIFDEDSRLLYDQSIRFPSGFHDTRQVDMLLAELANDGFDTKMLTQACAIHNEFLRHFDTGI